MSASRFTGRKAPISRGPSSPSQSIMFKLDSFSISQPPNSKTDHVVGMLMHDVVLKPGDDEGNGREILYAEFDQEGNPVTPAKFFIRAPAAGTPADRMPRNVIGLAQKRGSGDPITAGGVVTIDSVFVNADGSFSGRSFHGKATAAQLLEGTDPVFNSPAPPECAPEVGLVHIAEPNQQQRASGKSLRQMVTFLNTGIARPLEPDQDGSFVESIKTAIAEYSDYARQYNCQLAFAIVANSEDPEMANVGGRFGDFSTIYNVKVDDQYLIPAPEAALESFMTRLERNQQDQLAKVIKGEEPGFSLTYIPGFSPSQGVGTNPYNTPKPGDRQPRNLASYCNIYDTESETGSVYTYSKQGMVPVAITLARTGGPAKGTAYGYMMSDIEILQAGVAYMASDIATPYTSDANRKDIDKMGRQNQVLARKLRAAETAAKPGQDTPADGTGGGGTGSAQDLEDHVPF